MKQYCLMLVAFFAMGGCSTTAPEQKALGKAPLAVIQFEKDSARFNNVPAVREQLNDVDRFGLVAYAGSREEYELAYKRFKVISDSLKRTGLLHVKHPDRATEENRVLLFDDADMSALKSSNRFVVMPEGQSLLSSQDYRKFQREALRQQVQLSSGPLKQQLRSFADYFGWELNYVGRSISNQELSIAALELALISDEPSGIELRKVVGEALSKAGVKHEIQTDIKYKTMEVVIL